MDPTDSAPANPKSELIDKLKNSNNVLVTVSRDPSVDQLAALLGLTLLLNKQGKHAAAVFSGEVPSTIEFLQPDETIEKNTDSLRDFIIALDKSKADKLRYKVEDNVVRIFITPYKTSISQEDLEFSQGDFNVDIIVAIGVHEQADLDEAITAHGRILHDATITSITTSADGELGSINWHDPGASSLSEMVTELAEGLDGSLIDGQIATALLTGIVAETKRFSNEKTTSQTMSISAVLMGAGANQQLVASKLSEEPQPNVPLAEAPVGETEQPHDGALEIDHDASQDQPDQSEDEQPPLADPAPEPPTAPSDGSGSAGPEIDDVKATDASSDNSMFAPPAPQVTDTPADTANELSGDSKIMTEPPVMGGMLTANTQTEDMAPSTDVLGLPTSNETPTLLDHNSVPAAPAVDQSAVPAPVASVPDAVTQVMTPPPAWIPPADTPAPVPLPPAADTLTQLETSVDSPHLDSQDLSNARDAVTSAMGPTDVLPTGAMEPVAALNAQPLGEDLHPADIPAPAPATSEAGPSFNDLFSSEPTAPAGSPTTPLSTDPTASANPQVSDPTAPPPVPPPIPFQFGGPQPPAQ